MDTLRRFDYRIFLDVNSFARHTGWLHGAVTDYAAYGVVLFALLLGAGILLARRGSDRALAAAGWAPIAMLLAVAVNQPIGSWIAEARPYASHPHLLVLATRTSDFSFPSDHAVMAGAAATGLLIASRRLGGIVAALALLMAGSRIYIAAHYPWDVVAGLLLGAGVSILGWVVLGPVLVTATGWLRGQPPLRAVFGERAAQTRSRSVTSPPAADI